MVVWADLNIGSPGDTHVWDRRAPGCCSAACPGGDRELTICLGFDQVTLGLRVCQ